MTAWGNIDKANNTIGVMNVDNISEKDRISRPERIETSDGYDIHRVKNNQTLDDWYDNWWSDMSDDENWIEQNTSWLVQDIPNISFLDIWDTLLESKKTLYARAWAKLIVWKASKSIELMYKNKCKLSFEPNYSSDVENLVRRDIDSPYVTWLWDNPDYATLYQAFGPLAVMIEEDWRYRITHKEEIELQSTQDTICCYVDVYRKDVNDVYQILIKWWIAVSWFEWKWTLTWTTSWTDPNGSCSITFKLWQIMQHVPTMWYIERELQKWDILVLRMRDMTPDSSTWAMRWNELTIYPYSNIFSIEYIDLP